MLEPSNRGTPRVDARPPDPLAERLRYGHAANNMGTDQSWANLPGISDDRPSCYRSGF